MLPVVAAAASLASILVVWFVVGWWTWRPLVRRRVVVQLDDGSSFDGVAMSRRGPLLVLDDVTVRVSGGSQRIGSQRIDGRVVIERPRVVFVQVI